MNIKRRKIIKSIFVIFFSISFHKFNKLLALENSKKIINPNLTDEQISVMFGGATELSGSSKLNFEKRKGSYHCANCKAKLFASVAKFESGTGWPSFTDAIPGAFKTKIDLSYGMKRTAYYCAKCGAHHGHVFNDGPGPSGKRYCSNGVCLIFIPD
tara:strand:+ start:571 stop:1038 length:468 start_codon:yes stop_codon:yes gene_type:complete